MSDSSRKVVKGEVHQTPRLGFWNLIFEGDIETAFKLAIKSVLVPRIQDILYNFGDTVFRQTVWGDKGPTNDPRGNGGTNYAHISSNGGTVYANNIDQGANRLDVSNVEIENYSDAKNVVDRLREQKTRFNRIPTLLDFYDFAGLPTTSVDDSYGWATIPERVPIEKSRNGWRIRLPKAVEIERNERR